MRRVKPGQGDMELTLTLGTKRGIRIRRRQRQRTSDFTAAIKFAVSFSSNTTPQVNVFQTLLFLSGSINAGQITI